MKEDCSTLWFVVLGKKMEMLRSCGSLKREEE